jgi:hypothetical protein
MIILPSSFKYLIVNGLPDVIGSYGVIFAVEYKNDNVLLEKGDCQQASTTQE